MANILDQSKKATVISMLAEGSSIRSIERITNVHRDTIMRLGLRVGQACEKLMDEKMRNLNCERVQVDELFGYVRKHDKEIKQGEDARFIGSQYVFIALDADSKLVPCFQVGKRDGYNANTFMGDLASRLNNRIQLSTDAFSPYEDATERAFGTQIDYAKIVKTFALSDLSPQRRYSPPEVVSIKKTVVTGNPKREDISTSFVESQNLTVRMHCRRLARLTSAYSKKFENYKAAVALHFAYYNFVKIHSTVRMTPAMAAGVEKSQWTVAELIERCGE